MKITCSLLFIFCLSFIPATAQDYLLQSVKKHGRVNAVKFSPDGTHILSGGEDRTAYLWESSTGKDILTLTGHYSEVQTVTFNKPSNQYLASSNNVVLLYDQSGKILNTFRGHTTMIWTLSLHPEYRYFATGSFEKIIRIWDIGNPRPLYQLEGHEDSNLAVCFSPDGKYLVSGSLDETIRVWSFETRETEYILRGHTGNIYAITFSADGTLMASAAFDNTVRLWSTETWECLNTFTGHEKSVFSLAFSPDGHLLLSASADHSIRLWQVKNGNHLYTFQGHTAPVVALDFHPSGNSFVSGSHDGTIRTWELHPEILVNFYYAEEVKAETEKSALSGPRESNESRNDFRLRQEQLEAWKKELVHDYYRRYQKEILGK